MATRYTMAGTVAGVTAAILAALVAMSGGERAQSLGLTQHGALITAQDAGAADAVATVAVSPGTAGQVLTVSDAGLPHWAAAAAGGSSWGTTTVDPMAGAGWTATEPLGTSAVWSGGELTMTLPVSNAGVLRVDFPWTAPAGTTAFDFAVRFSATTTAGGTAAFGAYVYLASAYGRYVGTTVQPNGGVGAGWNVAGVNDAVSFTSSGLTLSSEQSWLRVSRDSTGVWTFWYGSGAGGELPTQWSRRHLLDSADGAGLPVLSLHFAVYGVGGTPSANFIVTVHEIRYTSAGSL